MTRNSRNWTKEIKGLDLKEICGLFKEEKKIITNWYIALVSELKGTII